MKIPKSNTKVIALKDFELKGNSQIISGIEWSNLIPEILYIKKGQVYEISISNFKSEKELTVYSYPKNKKHLRPKGKFLTVQLIVPDKYGLDIRGISGVQEQDIPEDVFEITDRNLLTKTYVEEYFGFSGTPEQLAEKAKTYKKYYDGYEWVNLYINSDVQRDYYDAYSVCNMIVTCSRLESDEEYEKRKSQEKERARKSRESAKKRKETLKKKELEELARLKAKYEGENK